MPDQATERTTIDASPERVLEATLAFEDYPSWAHDIKETEVLERDGEGRGTKVRYRAAAMGRSTTYVLGYDYSALPHTLSWQLLESDITRQLDGSYEFAPVDGDAGRTDVTYHLTVELVVPLPSFVKRRAETRIVHTALRELKAWVERDAAA
ncbi:MAG: SRPBCC family protein [Acidimicrobiales bacterium]|nr:SRPBCC family protein [Acidimicrobiales bacterium]